jgi:DNA helicase-2/ATP-dependent DNA helicase PcrA
MRSIIDAGKVEDPSQIAFLYPSLKSPQVGRMIEALEQVGLQVYAPRAGKFLEVPEATDVFGVFLQILGKPKRGDFPGHDYHEFHNWLDGAEARGKELVGEDKELKGLVRNRQEDIRRAIEDRQGLFKVISRANWDLNSPYRPDVMKRRIHEAAGISDKARRSIASARFERFVRAREALGRPFTLEYVVTRASSIDWTVLELFYQISAFDHFRRMFDLAERGKDEGPICNLSLVSQYLARFQEEYVGFITAEVLEGGRLQQLLYGSFLYSIFRLGESEYEDAEDPFPRGRIPFLTIHQAKGLEFPVVVLGNPRKKTLEAQPVEKLVRPLLRRQGEPIDRVGTFDAMRLFYVAISRAQNLLVIPHFKGQGQSQFWPFKEVLDEDPPRISDLDVEKLPSARLAEGAPPRTYSFTADYLLYRRCARQYMIFRKYDFAPSTTQTQFFGSLVHQTLDDLHQHLIALRGGNDG